MNPLFTVWYKQVEDLGDEKAAEMMVAKYSAMQRYRKSGSARRSSFGRVNRENPNSNSPKSSTKNLEKQPNTENEKEAKVFKKQMKNENKPVKFVERNMRQLILNNTRRLNISQLLQYREYRAKEQFKLRR